ncbi:MAG TPA: protein kinase [Gemmatimonadales bacterium]
MAEPSPATPRVLADRYVLEREVGRGGMATVYLARDVKHDRQVAIKILHPELAAALGPGRFAREIRIAAGLSHPHILPLYDSGEAEGTLYYVMPYVAGGTLRGRLDREGPLPLDEAVRIAIAIAESLAVAHDHGIVHRDIKPENVLLEDGVPLVSDFGIARLIGAAGQDTISSSGLPIGTPAYMSPEQTVAGATVDGRSDIYSLGCVLYEMLAGERPFSGPTPQAVVMRHLYEPVPALRLVRPGAPDWLQAVLEKALAKTPADRYPTALALATALSAGAGPAARQRRRQRGWYVITALLAIGGAAVASWFAWRTWGPTDVDRQLYVVLPFRQAQGQATRLVTGDLVESLLYDALSRWRDLRLVSSLRVRDALLRRERPIATLEDGLHTARELRAGTLIWGEVSERGDTALVRAALYDVVRPDAPVREEELRITASDRDVGVAFARMATLLVGGLATETAGETGLATHSFAAVRSYGAADSALASWNLELARQHLRAALAIDPTFAQANLRLALIGNWLGEPPATWQAALASAEARRADLAPADSLLVEALSAMARRDYPQACAAYRQRLARDTLDVVGWLGLGDCQARDPLVQPDPLSRSRWRFRSSYQAALHAYRRALDLVPSAYLLFRKNGFARLKQVAYAQATLRYGYRVQEDTLWFAAWPSWEHDSLAFVPFRRDDVLGSRQGTFPPSLLLAEEHGRELLRNLSRTWIQAFPDSAEPKVLLAELLELDGDLNAAQPDRDSALHLLSLAVARTADPDLKVQITVGRIRIILKLGQFDQAHDLADSMLRAWPDPPGRIANSLAPLAQLLGRPRQASDLMLRNLLLQSPEMGPFFTADAERVSIPSGLVQPALVLLAYASAGADRDTIIALEGRIERILQGLVPRAQQAAVRQALLDEPSEFSFSAAGLRPAHRPETGARWILKLQWHAAHGHTDTVRAMFGSWDKAFALDRPGEAAIDDLLQQAEVLLMLRDSAAAAARLDVALDALPVSRLDLLATLNRPAALVRTMALRSELAWAMGQREIAARWAGAVTALWSEGEPTVRPVVHRIDAIRHAATAAFR